MYVPVFQRKWEHFVARQEAFPEAGKIPECCSLYFDRRCAVSEVPSCMWRDGVSGRIIVRNGFGVVPHERTSEVDYSEIRIVFIVRFLFHLAVTGYIMKAPKWCEFLNPISHKCLGIFNDTGIPGDCPYPITYLSLREVCAGVQRVWMGMGRMLGALVIMKCWESLSISCVSYINLPFHPAVTFFFFWWSHMWFIH